MSAGWQDLSVAGEKHMRRGAPSYILLWTYTSVDVCLQDETWELEALLLVSKYLLCQSTRNFIGDVFPKDTVSISMKSLHIHGVPFCLLSSLTCIINDPSSVHGLFVFVFSFPWMHHTLGGTEPSHVLFLLANAPQAPVLTTTIITPVMICFFL